MPSALDDLNSRANLRSSISRKSTGSTKPYLLSVLGVRSGPLLDSSSLPLTYKVNWVESPYTVAFVLLGLSPTVAVQRRNSASVRV